MMDIQEAIRIFNYDPDTGNFTWKVSVSNRAPIGSIAGTLKSDGYRRLYINKKACYAHRLAWAITFGKFPDNEIDHINGDPTDNRISNLRAATSQQNGINRKLQKNNSSGKKGVSWHKQMEKWTSRITNPITGSYESLGLYSDIQSAADAYKARAVQIHGEYARKGD